MLDYAVWQWDHNKDELLNAIREKVHVGHVDYEQLMQLTIRHILNGQIKMRGFEAYTWAEDFKTIDDGDYQGTLIFLIHRETYQPSEGEYLITFVKYGSCSVCDTIQSIRGIPDAEKRNKEYLGLCRDMLVRMKAPFDAYDCWEEAEFE